MVEMFYLISAVLCAVIFAVMFRICGIWKVSMGIVMVTNYVTGMVLCCGQIGGGMGIKGYFLAVLIGIIYAGGFVLAKRSTEKCGIALTTVVSKSSFLIPVILSWLTIGDKEPIWAVIVMILTALMMIYRPKEAKMDWSLFTVFVVYGLADFMLRFLKFIGEGSGTATFVIFVSATVVSGFLCIKGRKEHVLKSIGAGIVMGTANTGVTYMILQSLGNMPATTFYPLFNTSVILLCSIIAVVAFKEKPDKIQWVGIALAAAAICINC